MLATTRQKLLLFRIRGAAILLAGGPGSGCHGDNCGRPSLGRSGGKGAPGKGRLKPSAQRAFNGKPVALKTSLSKQEAGKLGEELIIAHLYQKGLLDARPLNSHINNYPVDLVQDHGAIEVKTGLVSNGEGAQKWRATIGQPGKKESAWLSKASPAAKAKWNEKKMKAILDRKQAVVKQLSKQLGRPVKAQTMTVLLNPDTRTADIYKFDGFHLHIRWNSEATKNAYVGSYKYRSG